MYLVELEVLKDGALSCRELCLGEGTRVTGGRLDCDIALVESTVSRKHFMLSVREGNLVLTDLGSTAGTILKGKPCKQAFVKRGDAFVVGPYILRIKAFEQVAAIEPVLVSPLSKTVATATFLIDLVGPDGAL
jgi:pSer/pThr/pTyr-binding forkhead associated (FHA) protein